MNNILLNIIKKTQKGLICLSSLLTTESLPSLRVLHLGHNPLTS